MRCWGSKSWDDSKYIFRMEDIGGGRTGLSSLRTGAKCADEGNRMRCDRGGWGGWEKHVIGFDGHANYIMGRGNGGRYCADEYNKLRCNRGGVGGWERFDSGARGRPPLRLARPACSP